MIAAFEERVINGLGAIYKMLNSNNQLLERIAIAVEKAADSSTKGARFMRKATEYKNFDWDAIGGRNTTQRQGRFTRLRMMNKTPQSVAIAILQQLKKEKKVGRNYHIYLPSTLLFGSLLYHQFRELLKK